MEIVKHHNDINKIRVGTLNERELNLFISILFKTQESKEEKVNITFRELIALEESKNRSHKRLVESILKMNKKLITLNQTIKTERGYITFNLFNDLTILEDTKEIKISINENFRYMLNGLIKDFTYYSLKEYINLSSTYSKQVYRLLKQFRKNGWYHIDLETFKEVLGVPNNETRYLNQFVLAPILKELAPLFKDLKIIKLTIDNKLVGRGRKTHSLKFEWDKSGSKRNTLQENIKNRDDKIKAAATKRAKIKHLEVEEKVNNKKVLSDLDVAKGKLCASLSKKGKFDEIVKVSGISTLEELKEYENNLE